MVPLAPLHRLLAPFDIVQLPPAPLRALLKPIIPRSREEICDTLTKAAHSNDLPAPFFIRLIFQESEFKSATISPAGALGIAQFMPETAADRGLDNPFDPLQAIPASARLLRDLAQQFGNLGLAAAAYNAGARRIAAWLANKAKLPQETQGYVKTITGRPAENWTAAQAGSPALKVPRHAPCQEAAGLLAWDGPDQIPLPQPNPRTLEKTSHTKVADKHAATAGAARDKAHHASRHAGTRGDDAKSADASHKRPADAEQKKPAQAEHKDLAQAEKKRGETAHAAKADTSRKRHVETEHVAARRHARHRKVQVSER